MFSAGFHPFEQKEEKKKQKTEFGRIVFEVAVPNIWRLELEMINVMAVQ